MYNQSLSLLKTWTNVAHAMVETTPATIPHSRALALARPNASIPSDLTLANACLDTKLWRPTALTSMNAFKITEVATLTQSVKTALGLSIALAGQASAETE